MEVKDVKYIAIHCSASRPSLKVNAEVIDRWHRQKGFRKIGYHFVINRNGVIENGRDLSEVGAHVEGYNSVSIGVCMVGGLDDNNKPTDNFTDAQYESLKMLLGELKLKFVNTTILGHRDFPKVKKDCPCFDVKSWCKINNI